MNLKSLREVPNPSCDLLLLFDFVNGILRLGMRLLLCGRPQAHQLLRCVASRRRDRCELSLIAAVIALVQQDRSLFEALSTYTKLKLEAALANVSRHQDCEHFKERRG